MRRYKHLKNIFKLFPPRTTIEDENELRTYLEVPSQMDLFIKNFKVLEIRNVVSKEIISKKTPAH